MDNKFNKVVLSINAHPDDAEVYWQHLGGGFQKEPQVQNDFAEELALKTNEITRKKSAYLEGTFAIHGIEEVMDKSEVLIWVDPFEEEQEKFKECLVDGVGMNILPNSIF